MNGGSSNVLTSQVYPPQHAIDRAFVAHRAACVDASTRSLELKKLAAYNRLIAYPRRAEPKGFRDHCARPCRKKRSASPRSYVEPQFDPFPLQSLLARFAFPVLVYAGTTQATIISKVGLF